MQTPDNPDYYLKHGFDKAYSNYRFPLSEIEEAYRIFENRLDGVIKVAITADKPQKFGRQ